MVYSRILSLIREKVMKKASFGTFWAILLCVFAAWLCGCAQPGETCAEGARRHKRTLEINQQELMRDIDRAALYDEPSRRTDMRIP